MKAYHLTLVVIIFASLISASKIEDYYVRLYGVEEYNSIKSCNKLDEQCELIIDVNNGYLSYMISELGTNRTVMAIFKTASKEDRIAVGIYSYPEYGPSYMNRKVPQNPYSHFAMLKISENKLDTLSVIPEITPKDFGILGEWINVKNNDGSIYYRDNNDFVQIHFQEEIPQFGTNLKVYLVILPSKRMESLYQKNQQGIEPSQEFKKQWYEMKRLIDGIYAKISESYIECRWDRENVKFVK